MKVFFDTEFTGLHKDTTLISIGLVAEDGRTFYAELTDYDKSQCDDWIVEHVINNLQYPGGVVTVADETKTVIVGDKEQVRERLDEWFKQFDSVTLVSDVCHYDMVLLIDIFGHAFKLPRCVNAACHDINQDIAKYYGISEADAFDKSREEILAEHEKSVSGAKHNSLYDAKVIMGIYQIIH